MLNDEAATLRCPFIWIAGFLGFGILAGEYVQLPAGYFFLLTVAFIFAAVVAIKTRRLSSVLLLIAFFCLGGSLCQSYKALDENHVWHVVRGSFEVYHGLVWIQVQ